LHPNSVNIKENLGVFSNGTFSFIFGVICLYETITLKIWFEIQIENYEHAGIEIQTNLLYVSTNIYTVIIHIMNIIY
jgi:hypothetical protein